MAMASSVFTETVKLSFRVEPAISHPSSVSSRLSASSPPFGTLICVGSSDGMVAMVSLVVNDAGWHFGASLCAGICLLVKDFFRPLLKFKKLFCVCLHVVSFYVVDLLSFSRDRVCKIFSKYANRLFILLMKSFSGPKILFFLIYNLSFSVKFKIFMPCQRFQKI